MSEHPEISQQIESFVAGVNRQKKLKTAVEVQSVPAVIERASFRKSYVLTNEKLMLSGASRKRILNSYRWDHVDGQDAAADVLNAYLEKCRSTNEGLRIGEEKTFIESDLDFAIACRNTFNFYHFITESLSQLCSGRCGVSG